jgi:hypothetical protein
MRFSILENRLCALSAEKKKAMGRNAINDGNPGGIDMEL